RAELLSSTLINVGFTSATDFNDDWIETTTSFTGCTDRPPHQRQRRHTAYTQCLSRCSWEPGEPGRSHHPRNWPHRLRIQPAPRERQPVGVLSGNLTPTVSNTSSTPQGLSVR